jgi:hypothetical protein
MWYSRLMQQVLSGFAAHLASYIDRSLSNHSYGFAFSDDRPIYFASCTAIPRSLMNHPGSPGNK